MLVRQQHLGQHQRALSRVHGRLARIDSFPRLARHCAAGMLKAPFRVNGIDSSSHVPTG